MNELNNNIEKRANSTHHGRKHRAKNTHSLTRENHSDADKQRIKHSVEKTHNNNHN